MSRYITPLRYPGGKQRLTPFIQEIIDLNEMTGCTYAEPYAGGAGVGLELLIHDQVSSIHLNDSSLNIFAFWHAMLTHPEAFCERIRRASLSVENWRIHREIVRNPEDHDLLDVGFSTFYLNRCNRSGILTGGVIGGLKQEGAWRIDARFPRNELIRRIELISTKAKRISVTNLDAEEFMTDYARKKIPPGSLAYCDPPYFERSDRLYLNSYNPEDHKRVAKVIQSDLPFPWIVSYDSHPNLIKHYRERRRFVYSLSYSAVRARTGTEVFIFSDDLKIPSVSRLPAIQEALVNSATC